MSQQPPYPQQPGGQPPYQQPGGYPPGQQPGYPGQPAPGGQPPYQQPYQPGYPPYQGYGQPGPNWQQPPELSGPAPGVRFAGHGARFGAYVLDGIIVGTLFSVVFWVLAIAIAGSTFTSFDWQVYSETSRFDSAAALELLRPLLILVPLLFGLGFLSMLYFVAGWAMGGQTLGMRMAGIRVVRDRDGGRIGWGAAIVRLIGYFVSAVPFYLGFIWILIDGRRRGWHDLLAGTVVIAAR